MTWRVETQDDEFGPEWTWLADVSREDAAQGLVVWVNMQTGGTIETRITNNTAAQLWVCHNTATRVRCNPKNHSPTTGRGDFKRPSIHARCGWEQA